jgi:hypothetical protein
MNSRIIIFAFLFIVTGWLRAQYGGIRNANALDEVKKIIQNDSIAAFEYECALEFHAIINEYRASNRTKPLAFNYMAVNNDFSHNQKKGKAMFSGISPLKRIEFTLNHKLNIGCGENIVEFSKFENLTASNVAAMAFEIWKNSEGHNQNMLTKMYKEHGTAFLWIEGRDDELKHFLAADVFSESIKFPNKINSTSGSPVMVSENNYARTVSKGNPEKSSKFNVAFIKKELGNEFYYLKVRDSLPDQWKRSDRLSKKCLERSDEVLAKQSKNKSHNATIATEGSFTSTDQTSVKPSFIHRIFGKDDHTVITVLYGFNEENFYAPEIAREVYKSWLENLPSDAQRLSYGYHIGVKKKGANYWICAALEVGE